MGEPVTEADAATLRHMLGIVNLSRREPEPTRDYYAADPGDEQMARLVALGLVERCGDAWGYEYHRTTEAGKAAALADFKRRREPKSKRVYARFLDIADVVPGLKFREFITSERFAEIRRTA